MAQQKMRRNRWVYLALLVILAGCDVMPGSGNHIEVYDPYYGSQGIVIGFLENNPPESVKESQTFRIGFRVSNQGAHDVENARLRLDYNSADLSISNPEKTITLHGRSKHIKNGETDVVFWEVSPKSVSSDVLTEVGLTTTYSYQTNAFVDYCIDPHLYGEERSKTCTVEKTISLQDQGAPVAVKKIESEVFAEDNRGEIELTIIVDNIGNGWVSSGGMNSVRLAAEMSGQSLTCEPSIVQLEEGTGESMCTYRYQASDEYRAPLHITLDYDYRDVLEKREIRIKSE